MKKLFIICLALIISLTSCELSFLGGKDKTPEPELPMSETVTLAELINKKDVAYIKHRSRIFLCSNFLYATAYNVDDLFDLLIVPNLEKEFITDLADVHDQYDENYGNAFSYVKNSRYEYVEWYFYSESGKNIGILTLYPNNYICYLDFNSKVNYVSVDYSNVDVNELIDTLYQSDYLDK